MKEPFFLSTAEKNTGTWQRLLKIYLADRLEALRDQLEATTEPARTEKLRGRIAEIRALMALDKDPVPKAAPAIDDF